MSDESFKQELIDQMDTDLSGRGIKAHELLDDILVLSGLHKDESLELGAVQKALELLAEAHQEGLPVTESLVDKMRDRGFL